MGASGSKQGSRELVEACTVLDVASDVTEIASLFRKAVNGATLFRCVRGAWCMCVYVCFLAKVFLLSRGKKNAHCFQLPLLLSMQQVAPVTSLHRMLCRPRPKSVRE